MKKIVITISLLHKKGWKEKNISLTDTELEKNGNTIWWCNVHHRPIQQIVHKNGKSIILKKYEL